LRLLKVKGPNSIHEYKNVVVAVASNWGLLFMMLSFSELDPLFRT